MDARKMWSNSNVKLLRELQNYAQMITNYTGENPFLEGANLVHDHNQVIKLVASNRKYPSSAFKVIQTDISMSGYRSSYPMLKLSLRMKQKFREIYI